MIRKLRRKFILTCMGLVTIVLLIVFSGLFAASWQTMQAQVDLTLTRALEDVITSDIPSLELPFSGGSKREQALEEFFSYPVFVVTVNQQGYVSQVIGRNVSVSLELAEHAVLAAARTGETEGSIPGVHMQFRCAQNAYGGMRFAFVETSALADSTAALVASCVLALFCSLAIFFFIARYLANEAVRPVATAWEQQRQFVADASHELKTPLTVILANTGILLSHPDSTIGEQSKWLENTQAEAQRMKKLVEELLFLARSDSAKTPLTLSTVSLSDTLWSCLLPFETIAFESGVTLDSDIADGIALTGDASQLKQLMMILLDNACKYTPRGGIITVRLARAGNSALLTINNTGEPIPAEDLPHLFERFYRSDKSRAREAGGYGLGLAIAKNLTEAHKGKISVESDQVHGTTFAVTLPITKEKEKIRPALPSG